MPESKLGAALAAGLFLFVAAAFAPAGAASLEVKDAWVRGTVAAQRSTGAFMQLTSPAGATLTGAASPVAGKVELHEMSMDGDTMRMRALSRLNVPAGKSVELKPGGYHLMLLDLREPLPAGRTVPITLQLEAGGKVERLEIQAEVRSLTGAPAGAPMHHDHMGK